MLSIPIQYEKSTSSFCIKVIYNAKRINVCRKTYVFNLIYIIHCSIMYHVDYSFESEADDEATD